MFNIKKKIYVVQNSELVDLMYERSIIMHPDFRGVSVPTFEGIEDDVTARGVVFVESSLNDAIENVFGGDWQKFHDFLLREEDLQIVVSEHDYVKLFKMVQSELSKTFGVSNANLKKMRDAQILKDYMSGNALMSTFCKTGGFEQVYNATEYTALGKLYGNIFELPFEVAYVLYKWGNISELQVNVKIAALAEGLLLGQIHNLVESAKVALGASPALLQQFLDDDTIESVDDIMSAIEGNALLKELFRHECVGGHHGDIPFDLTNADTIAELKRFCYAAIDNELDYDSQPDVDKAEIDFFFDLNEKKDVAVLENAKYNFISTGLISSKAEKFNSILLMSA